MWTKKVDKDGKYRMTHWASQIALNHLFNVGKPSKNLEEVGLTIHCFDDTENARQASQDNHQTVFDRDAYRMLMSALRKGKLDLVDAVTLESVDNPLIGENFD